MIAVKTVALFMALCGAATAANAQTAAPSTKTPSSLQDSPSDSLSTKLDKTGGVITPKEDVDPGIKVPAPVSHPNSTPVIPPSATGGQGAK